MVYVIIFADILMQEPAIVKKPPNHSPQTVKISDLRKQKDTLIQMVSMEIIHTREIEILPIIGM